MTDKPYVNNQSVITNGPDGEIIPVELCLICLQPVEVMSFRGTGVCSTNCWKQAHGEAVVRDPESRLPG